jgi:hypothetical protein
VSHVERYGSLGVPSPELVRATWEDEAVHTMGLALAEHEGAWRREMEPSRKTGTSMRSIASEVEVLGAQVHGHVGSNYLPVVAVNEGSGLWGPTHDVIRPKHAGALRFPQPGNGGFTLGGRQRSGSAGAGASWVFAKFVRGIKPRQYAQRAAAEVRPRVLDIAEGLGMRMQARLRGRA